MDTSKWPEKMIDAYETILLKLKDLPDAEERAHAILNALCNDVLGGTQVYFPKGDTFKRQQRDMRIYKSFTGFNHQDLALKFKLSERHIYAILDQQRKLWIKKRQKTLPLQ